MGIGTSSPAAFTGFTTNRTVLQVKNPTSDSGQLILGSSVYCGLLDYDNAAGNITFRNTYGAASTGALINIDSGTLAFRTGTSYTERMRITSAGNVGIGTSSPLTPLHVVGTATISESSGAGAVSIGNSTGRAQYQIINLGGAVGGTDYAWQIGRSPSGGVGPTDGFYIYDLRGNTTRMVIDTSGNVGIGTTSPNTTAANRTVLEVNGVTSALLNISGGGTRRGTFYADSTDCVFGSITSIPLEFLTGGVERMRIDSNGVVGIGTSTPSSYAFSLAIDNANATNTGYIVNLLSGGSSWFKIGRLVASSTAILQSGQNLSLQPDSGNVGIGTTSPGFKLTTVSSFNAIAAFESQASGSVNSSIYNVVLGRSTNSIAHSTTTQIAGGYGGGIVLIVMRNVTGSDTQYTYVVTWGWNSASVLFTNSYGSNGTTSTFTASGGGLFVNHDHTTGNCYYALSALLNGTS
jgi:hypothetical protein